MEEFLFCKFIFKFYSFIFEVIFRYREVGDGEKFFIKEASGENIGWWWEERG